MTDSMVTARMSPEKKRSGNSVLEQLGINASQAINLLYDYVLDYRELPFNVPCAASSFSDEKLTDALEWLDSIPTLDNDTALETLTPDDIRRQRLQAKGLFDGWNVR